MPMVFVYMSAGCITVLLNTFVPQSSPDCTKINHKLITMVGLAEAMPVETVLR